MQYQLDRFLRQLDKLDLLVCDELGYLSFNRSGAELLIQVFAYRYERPSLLITRNLPFSEGSRTSGKTDDGGSLGATPSAEPPLRRWCNCIRRFLD